MLEEGLYSEPLTAFHQQGINPNIRLRVHDDYSILSMVEAGLGYSILADLVLQKQDYQVAIRPLAPVVERKIGLYQRDPELMPLANRLKSSNCRKLPWRAVQPGQEPLTLGKVQLGMVLQVVRFR